MGNLKWGGALGGDLTPQVKRIGWEPMHRSCRWRTREPELEYVDCCGQAAPEQRFHPRGFCAHLDRWGPGRVLIVGDSMNGPFGLAGALVTMLGQLGGREQQPDHIAPSASSNWRICNGSRALEFVRNDVLDPSESYDGPMRGSRTGKQGYDCGPRFREIGEMYCNPWIDRVGGAVLVVLNAGAHGGYNSNRTLSLGLYHDSMMRAAKAVRTRWGERHGHRQRGTADARLVFRNTPPGHPGCMTATRPYPGAVAAADALATAPAERRLDWLEYGDRNAVAEAVFSSAGFTVLNVATPTSLRPDRHLGVHLNDCLHYCLPGPVMLWVHMLYAAMVRGSGGAGGAKGGAGYPPPRAGRPDVRVPEKVRDHRLAACRRYAYRTGLVPPPPPNTCASRSIAHGGSRGEGSLADRRVGDVVIHPASGSVGDGGSAYTMHTASRGDRDGDGGSPYNGAHGGSASSGAGDGSRAYRRYAEAAVDESEDVEYAWLLVRGQTFRAGAEAAQTAAAASIAAHVLTPLQRSWPRAHVHTEWCVHPDALGRNSALLRWFMQPNAKPKATASLRHASSTSRADRGQWGLMRACLRFVPPAAAFTLVVRADMIFLRDLEGIGKARRGMLLFQWNLLHDCSTGEMADQVQCVGSSVHDATRSFRTDDLVLGVDVSGPSRTHELAQQISNMPSMHNLYNAAVRRLGPRRVGFLTSIDEGLCCFPPLVQEGRPSACTNTTCLMRGNVGRQYQGGTMGLPAHEGPPWWHPAIIFVFDKMIRLLGGGELPRAFEAAFAELNSTLGAQRSSPFMASGVASTSLGPRAAEEITARARFLDRVHTAIAAARAHDRAADRRSAFVDGAAREEKSK